MDKKRILEILHYLPGGIGKLIQDVMLDEWLDIEEIRLRVNSPLTISVWGESCFITNNGGITNHESDAYIVKAEEVQEAYREVSENSVYAHLEEICRGYITLKGGHRVGICGKAICEDNKIKNISDISSLNFRIAHQIIGLANGIIDAIADERKVKSTLIISPPQMGKTTLIRDITRQISNMGYKCGLADDRGELAAMYKGVPMNDVGAQTDIIDGAPKAKAIEMFLRTMSPKVIITDEITLKEDVDAIKIAKGTGVEIIATTHGSSVDEVKEKKLFASLFEEKVFEQVIVIHRDFSTPEAVTYTKVIAL